MLGRRGQISASLWEMKVVAVTQANAPALLCSQWSWDRGKLCVLGGLQEGERKGVDLSSRSGIKLQEY